MLRPTALEAPTPEFLRNHLAGLLAELKDEGVTEPEVTIRSVASTNPAEAESDLSRAGNHFLYNHLSDKFKLKTILPKPTNVSQQSKLQVPQMGDKISPPKPAPVCRARFAHLSKAENDGVEVSEYYKPCFSYKELIMLAIFSDPSGAICLNDIYMTIRKWFPYFRQRSIGLTWQNSIRHNLSLNDCLICLIKLNWRDINFDLAR